VTIAEWTDRDSDLLTVTLVAQDGHRLPLTGDDRRAAVEEMIRTGLSSATIAHRLCMSVDALHRWASRARVRLPGPPPSHWTVGYTDRSKRKPGRRP
jgi:transposase-like protein